MPTPQIQNDPIINLPFLYKYGLTISYVDDATLLIGPGTCRDSNNIIDIVVGSQNVEGNATPASLTLNFKVNGANGLDEGAVAEAEMYAIYIIADSRYYLPTACIATLDDNAFPIVPQGYDSLRLIGYWNTQPSEVDLEIGYYVGLGNDMSFYYDGSEPILTGGTSTTPALISLGSTLPLVQNTPAILSVQYTPAAAAPTSSLEISYAVSAQVQARMGGIVATVPLYQELEVLAQIIGGVPTLTYQVSAGDSVTMQLLSYSISV